MLTSDESKVNKFENIKKKIDNLKKRIAILVAKFEDRKVEEIFSNKEGSKSFLKTLSSLGSFNSSIPINTGSPNSSNRKLVTNDSSTCLLPALESNSEIDDNVLHQKL